MTNRIYYIWIPLTMPFWRNTPHVSLLPIVAIGKGTYIQTLGIRSCQDLFLSNKQWRVFMKRPGRFWRLSSVTTDSSETGMLFPHCPISLFTGINVTSNFFILRKFYLSPTTARYVSGVLECAQTILCRFCKNFTMHQWNDLRSEHTPHSLAMLLLIRPSTGAGAHPLI